MNYLSWDRKTLTEYDENKICEMYENGYLFTRLGKGILDQTRSIRIKLSEFELNSENRRILKKTEGIKLVTTALPLREYDFRLGKLAKDFYATKFGPGIMSAQKIKEILTDSARSNFNCLFVYSLYDATVGYTITYVNTSIIHYSYPFYDLDKSPKDMGMGMMIRAISQAKEKGLKYIYLGSLQRPSDTYKLQFSGTEWFDGKSWQKDIERVKLLLK